MIKITCTEEPFLELVLSKDQVHAIKNALIDKKLHYLTDKSGVVWKESDFCGALGNKAFTQRRVELFHQIADLLDYLSEVLGWKL